MGEVEVSGRQVGGLANDCVVDDWEREVAARANSLCNIAASVLHTWTLEAIERVAERLRSMHCE